jgi:hypothetical protein
VQKKVPSGVPGRLKYVNMIEIVEDKLCWQSACTETFVQRPPIFFSWWYCFHTLSLYAFLCQLIQIHISLPLLFSYTYRPRKPCNWLAGS